MCGIVGYIGKRQVFPILIKGLKRLEYRGYDSAGVAMINDNGDLSVYKTKGKVADLERFCEDKDISGTVGIAHTRWATHGEPSSVNAHPHYSESKNIAIIHNGIIENYADLKKKLVADGVKFRSDTDTEVIVQLIEYIQTRKNVDLLTAVRFALTQLIGAYAIAVLDKRDKDQIIAARKQSPLVIGIGEDEFFLGSDATPIIEYTDKVVYLDDDNIAVIRRGEDLKVVNTLNDTLNPEICTVDLDLGQIEKGGFPHFMLKEIFEQPECLENCMRGRINVEANNVTLSAVIDYRRQLLAAKRVIIVACGTSWHAGLIGKQLIESLCRIPVEVEYASEFRYRNPVIDSSDVVIAISQSGETADTLAAVNLAKDNGAFVWSMQRYRFEHTERHRHRFVYTRRTGDRRCLHQGIHRTGHRASDARTGTRQGEGHDYKRTILQDCQRTVYRAREDEVSVEAERQDIRIEQDLHLCQQFPLSGTWLQLSGCA